MDDVWKLCDLVRQTAFDLHVYFRHGHVEKVYENALVHRLRKIGVEVQQQASIQVHDQDGTQVGQYFADLMINRMLLVEVKAARAIASEHTVQLLGYLRSTRIEHGMLVNFGAPRFQVRKFALSGREGDRCFLTSN